MSMSNQVLYNTIGSSTTLFFQWLIIMLIPKIADFSDAGIFAVALSICSILNYVATLFLNQYQVADGYDKFNENDYYVCRIITIFTSFLLCIVTVFVSGYTTKQSLTIIAYMIYRNLLHFAYLHMATMQLNQHLDYAGKCMIIEGIMSFVSFILTYHTTKDLVLATFTMALVGGGLFLVLMSAGYNKQMGRRYPHKFTNLRVVIPMATIGIPLMISVMCPAMITAIPKIILQNYWSNEIVGIFSTLTAPTIIIPTLVTGMFTPYIIHFSDLRRRRDLAGIRKSFTKTIVLILVFALFTVVISTLFAEDVFQMLYGAEILPYVHLFNTLLIGMGIFSIGLCGITVLITKQQGKSAALLTIIALGLSIIIFVLSIPDGGIGAATNGLLVSYSLFACLITICVYLNPLSQSV